ncbi:MAG: carbohydrate kinase [Flavobacteriaceae bacterium]|nr:carbohydrate kinase [Flavobacteriaceae bacterium]
MYYLGIDIGSSSVKLALIDADTGKSIGVVQEPEKEMTIRSPKKGWAEQAPEDWWSNVCKGIERLKHQTEVDADAIRGIGIAYQMHGLVVVDQSGNSLRNSIIWCDSRAVKIGNEAFEALGTTHCESHLLNSPGNFTASKLAWVKSNEPELYDQIHKFMLPGDYVAFRFSDTMNTTISGLSEGIFWDFEKDTLSEAILAHFGFSKELVPDLVPTFGVQATVSAKGSEESGLKEGTPILYRAGDQPNNALSLNVLRPGEVAATGGTSGVMYAVTDSTSVSECAKVNNFAHVNYAIGQRQRIGKLLCINGAGIQYRWLLDNLDIDSYDQMNALASTIDVGSDGLILIPFGNGAERMLLNQEVGTRLLNLDLNRHQKGHVCRAALEGIAFAFVYGFEIMQKDGVDPKVIRAGNDNLFRSAIFANTVATMLDKEIEIYDTTGAVGAARACILQNGDYDAFTAVMGNDHVMTFMPLDNKEPYREAYRKWKEELKLILT